MKRPPALILIVTLIAAALLFWHVPAGPAATPPTLEQRVYWYPQEDVQQDIPCGGLMPAVTSVYVEIFETTPGVTSRQLVNGVRLNGTLLWKQEGDITLRATLGRNQIARYFQRIVGPGVWLFEARVGVSSTVCSIVR